MSFNSLETSILGEVEQEFHPINPLVFLEPIQFEIPETYQQLTDPSFLLKISCKITEADGSVLKDDVRVAPVNLTLHGLFSDIVLKINNTIVSQASGCYPYKSYIETNFTFSTAAKNGAVGIPQQYYKERAGKFEATIAQVNESFDNRVSKFSKSKVVEMAGRLNLNALLQSKHFVPGLRFSLVFFPSSTPFHIMSGTANAAEKLVITKATLKIRRLIISSQTILNLEKSLISRPIKYDLNHAVVRTVPLTSGLTMLSNYVLNNGQIPRLIILTTVSYASFIGTYNRNPFNLSLKKCLSAQL